MVTRAISWLSILARNEGNSMKKVNILDARNNLSKLVASVGQGEEVVIANRGKPVARLVATVDETPRHTAGQAAAWLASNPAPQCGSRTPAEIDRLISSEREGWE